MCNNSATYNCIYAQIIKSTHSLMEFLKYFEILKVYLSYVRKKHFRKNTSFQLNTEDTGVYFVVGF